MKVLLILSAFGKYVFFNKPFLFGNQFFVKY